MKITEFNDIIEPNDQTEARENNLREIVELVGNPYPNKFERSTISGKEDTITNLLEFEKVVEVSDEIAEVLKNLNEDEKPSPEVKEPLNEKLKSLGNVRIAGRLATPPRVMGGAAFVHLSDGKNRLQIYVRKQDAKAVSNDTGEILREGNTGFSLFKRLDHGDFVGVEGFLFLTNTGELSVHVEMLQFLSKAMLPMPDKMHGIADPELRRRYRYADLIGSSLQIDHEGLTTREVFERRAKIISSMRRYLEDHGYIEVETPMLTPKATGAAAKPFETHHNALDIPLYARIAPELYLKRLTVGGFEKVFELNRNFRNEGLSMKHNPEFTMLEFYCAYMDVNGMMDFCEEMLKKSVMDATGSLKVNYIEINTNPFTDKKYEEKREIDFNNFERISMKEAILRHLPRVENEKVDESWFEDLSKLNLLTEVAYQTNLEIRDDPNQKSGKQTPEVIWRVARSIHEDNYKNDSINRLSQVGQIVKIFEIVAEENLIQPTFIIDYPKSISPLSKASPENPAIAERFELFINGMEVANGFSELNDPKEQLDRFNDQMKEREGGDEEAMVLDEDYIRALSYGMPPAAGIGIGIDRIVMLLTNQHSIRDVILFPHMRPEKQEGEKGRNGDGENEEE